MLLFRRAECVFPQTDPSYLRSNHLYVPFPIPFQVNKKIFVRGLPWETTDQSLRAVFEQYGEIAEVRYTRMPYYVHFHLVNSIPFTELVKNIVHVERHDALQLAGRSPFPRVFRVPLVPLVLVDLHVLPTFFGFHPIVLW